MKDIYYEDEERGIEVSGVHFENEEPQSLRVEYNGKAVIMSFKNWFQLSWDQLSGDSND